MKETIITKATKEAIRVTMQALDEVIKEDIETLGDIGNPEKLMGKPFEEWTPEDFKMLDQVYGNDDTLKKFIFNKHYKEVKELEEEI